MAPGHDGNMWYLGAVGRSSTYGRITPAGVNTTMTLPDGQGTAITPNLDGNMYATAYNVNTSTCHVYQIHPDMSIVDLVAPYTCSLRYPGIMSIVSGYDRRLWVVDGSTSIRRIDTSGNISVLAAPEQVGIWVIRGNSAGRAMFTQGCPPDQSCDNVYRIAPDDSITSTQLEIWGPTAASDGFIYGAAGTAPGVGPYGLAKLSDTLTASKFLKNQIKAPALTTLQHRKTILLVAGSLFPDEGQLYRFDTTRDVYFPRWSQPKGTIAATLGPDHNLWESDGANVYIAVLP